ncbi:MAG: hypothetical protein EOO73_33970 [Myxococcales bacterium]|nr:MAG: hypothetical protein EOO73_33970 [Myxococcales bacterium]
MNANLLDDLRLIVHPLLLGSGRALFEGVTDRRTLQFVSSEPATAGRVVLSYRA